MIAANSPAHCFTMVFEAARLALKYMTPVILLTDGYIANGSEPWHLPSEAELPDISIPFAQNPETFQPYTRNEFNSRPWAVPGMPGFEHRIGGLEKQHNTGNVSHDPANHQFMVEMRAKKVADIAKDVPEQTVFGADEADLLLLGWGGTYGPIRAAVERLIGAGKSVAHAQVKYLNPFPRNLEAVMRRYKRILIPENNLGQLAYMIRANYLIEVISYPKVQGLPFTPAEIEAKANDILSSMESEAGNE